LSGQRGRVNHLRRDPRGESDDDLASAFKRAGTETVAVVGQRSHRPNADSLLPFRGWEYASGSSTTFGTEERRREYVSDFLVESFEYPNHRECFPP
jgi:hypothetical protein